MCLAVELTSIAREFVMNAQTTITDDDWIVARDRIRATLDTCARLVDNPTDPAARAAARQLINDNPQWVLHARQLVASLPEPR